MTFTYTTASQIIWFPLGITKSKRSTSSHQLSLSGGHLFRLKSTNCGGKITRCGLKLSEQPLIKYVYFIEPKLRPLFQYRDCWCHDRVEHQIYLLHFSIFIANDTDNTKTEIPSLSIKYFSISYLKQYNCAWS